MQTDAILEVDRQLVRYQLLGFPGVLMIGLGGYGLLARGKAFWSMLNVENLCIALIVLGACVAG
jgi:hypothetical protein